VVSPASLVTVTRWIPGVPNRSSRVNEPGSPAVKAPGVARVGSVDVTSRRPDHVVCGVPMLSSGATRSVTGSPTSAVDGRTA
jgi:hypothetical protein